MYRRLTTITISILALALLGSNCTFVASSNTNRHHDSEHADGNDGGLLIVVSDGDLGDRQVSGLRSRTTSVARSAAEPVDPPTPESLGTSAVPLLSVWGWVFLVGSLGGAGYGALRGRRDR